MHQFIETLIRVFPWDFLSIEVAELLQPKQLPLSICIRDYGQFIEFFNDVGVEKGMECAARYGYRDLVDFFIEKGAHQWNWAMCSAAEGGHRDLVDFFIEKGANDWNHGMVCAVEGGYLELVEFFIEKGARNWIRALQVAASGKHREIVRLLKTKDVPLWSLHERGLQLLRVSLFIVNHFDY